MSNIIHAEHVRHDPKIDADYKAIRDRQRQLQARLNANHAEQNQTIANIRALVFEDCDFTEYTDKLAALRAEAEALEWGMTEAQNRADLMRRYNNWLKN